MQNDLSGFRLSPQQRRLWLLAEGGAGLAAQCAVGLEGPLREEALREAWLRAVARHEILRTTFHEVPGLKAPVQVVGDETHASWQGPTAGDPSDLEELLRQERERPFDLARGPLARARLVRRGTGSHVLVLTLHPLCADATTFDILFDELSRVYAGRGGEADAPVQYVAFAEWQHELLEDEEGSDEREFWRGLDLADARARSLPSTVAAAEGFEFASHQFAFGRETAAAVERAAREAGVSEEGFLLACWHALVGRLTGAAETFVAVACDGRKYEDLRGSTGPFTKHAPVRLGLDDETTFGAALAAAEEAASAARDHSEYFDWEQSEAGGDFIPFAFEFARRPEPATAAGVTFEMLRRFVRLERFHVKLSCEWRGDSVAFELQYDTNVLTTAGAERLAGQFVALVASALEDTARSVGDLDAVGAEEREWLLRDFNRTAADVPRAESLCELFEAQAARTPDAVAVEAGDACLTYAELNARANQLARRLRRMGVGSDSLVGLLTTRSAEMLVGVWGVLKAGGAYVPLDPSYPRERLSFMIEDAGLRLVLTERALAEALPESAAVRLELDDGWNEIARESKANLTDVSAPGECLAYVIYTSGSTGRPKGVMVTRRGLLNYLAWSARAYPVEEGRGAPVHSPLGFDLTVTALFPPLLAGRRVSLVAEGHGVEGLLASLREGGGWSLVKLTPAHLDALGGLAPEGEDVSGWTRALVVGGEALFSEAVARWRERAPATRIFNEYGPTETVVGCCVHEVGAETPRAGAVPIGRPIYNTELYVLDARRRPAPTGVTGELYVGGAGVARGYLRRPGLTAESFVPHPFAREAGARLYRTGDLARHRGDGQLEYVGRFDQQVKVRGFRVELGEIEAALNGQESVRECVVVAREEEGRGRRLVAYVVGEGGVRPDAEALREELGRRLPEYMVPAVFVALERLPLTENGKVDRRALPAPEQARTEPAGKFVGPRTHAEEVLVEIWKQVLGVERVGVHDNFFRLGGDSILSIQIIARANRAGLRLTPQQLFEHQTVAKLAAAAGEAGQPEQEQTAAAGEVPLTPNQRWFFELEQPDPHHFNQSLLFEPARALDAAAVAGAVGALLAHHDALRTTFKHDEARGWLQQVAAPNTESVASAFEHRDLSNVSRDEQPATLEAEVERLQRGFDLARGPLLRVALFELGDGRQRLFVVAHHLVVDGVSWRIILEDLQAAYAQSSAGEVVSLAPKTAPFRRWAEHLQEYARTEALRGEAGYWLNRERAAVKRLPSDAGGENTVESARRVTLGLSPERTRALLQEVGRAYATRVEEVLLTAVGEALRRWAGGRRVLVELEGHGREEVGERTPDVSRTVGWFTASSPLLLSFNEEFEPGAALRRVKEQLRAVPGRGLGYGLLRYLGEDEEVRDSLRAIRRPEVAFNYLGQLDRVLDSGALFAPAPESAGQTMSPRAPRTHLLQVGGSVTDGRLQLSWGYSEAVHRRETVERVARECLSILEGLIDHCLAAEGRAYTPSDFPLAGLEQRALDRLLEGGREVEDIYPLSPLQQGILFHATHSPESGAYFEQISLTLQGELDEEAFRRAWAELVKRHTALRTSFVWNLRDHPLQLVSKEAELKWTRDDWRGLPPDEQRARLEAFVRSERERGFELERAPLMRLALMRVSDDAHYFVWSFHHLLLDGWSKNLLLGEFSSIYEAFAEGREPALAEPRPFRDYVAWLRRQDASAAASFWRERLRGFRGPTHLGGAPAAGFTDAGPAHGEELFRLSRETGRALDALARGHELTLNSIMQGVWALLLGQYSGEEDVLFGTVVSGRPADLPGVESIVGLFINTLPVRARLVPRETRAEWLRQFQAEQVEARRFEYVPLAEVQAWADATPPGQMLFETLFVFENYPVDTAPRESKADLRATHLPVAELTSFPLTVVAAPGDEPAVKVVYDRRRFEPAYVSRMLRHFRGLLEAVAADPSAPVSALTAVTEEESAQLVKSFTDDLEAF